MRVARQFQGQGGIQDVKADRLGERALQPRDFSGSAGPKKEKGRAGDFKRR